MIKVSTACCWDLVIFYFKEKCFVLHASASHLRDVYISKAFWRPCRKKNISGYIWHKLFIQTVKCSFFSHIIVDQSFYGALLTDYLFFTLRKNSLFRTRRQVTCEMFVSKAFWRPCRKNISGYIWHKLFIQTVKWQTDRQTDRQFIL